MNKTKLLPLFLIASSLVLTGCKSSSAGGDSTSSNTDSTPVDTTPVEETYKIKVTAPSGVHYSLDKQEAKSGESFKLTIESLDEGFSITSIVMNNKTVTLEASNVYDFVMPNRSVSIVIKCSVSGEVTLAGDVLAVLDDSDGDGVFVAKNVAVTTSNATAYFSYVVNGKSLPSSDLDERRCFANITFSTKDKSTEAFAIASGATYDFYYDTNSQYPLYVIRTNVDVLPQDPSSLQSLFDGSYHSETTANPSNVGLNNVQYKIKDISNSDNIQWNEYTWDLYENNTSFATVSDTANSDSKGNPKTYYVYKQADLEKNLLTVVDTYAESYGNNDRTRDEYNNHGAYSGYFDIVDVDDDNVGRYERYVGDATYTAKTGAHSGLYLDREIMYAYRTGWTADELDWTKIDVKSVATVDGFKTTIDSIAQYNSEESAYTSKRHEAICYTVELNFNANGSLSSLDYLQIQYKQAEWNFTTHEPLAGQDGHFQKSINCTYGYGDAKTGAPDFDLSPYFVKSFDKMHFFNKDCLDAVPGKVDDGVTNYVHFNDKVRISTPEADDKLNDLTLEYTPSTALDIWEYGPTASSDETVIAKTATDLYYYMSAIDIGSSEVTFDNHVKAAGISHKETINVVATKKYHSLAIWHQEWDDDGSSPVTSATSANIVAGTTGVFKVSCTPSNAPVIYDAKAYVDGQTPVYQTGFAGVEETRLKILTTGKKLTLDASAFADITTAVKVVVRCSSDTWFQDWQVTNHTNFTDFTFTITPASVDPVGSWKCTFGDEAPNDYVLAEFTTTASTKTAGYYVGTLTDHGEYDSGEYTDVFTFEYKYEKGYIFCNVLSADVSIEGADSLTFRIEFAFLSDYSTWGVALTYSEYDSDSETWYTDIWDSIGSVDVDGDVTGHLKLTRV